MRLRFLVILLFPVLLNGQVVIDLGNPATVTVSGSSQTSLDSVYSFSVTGVLYDSVRMQTSGYDTNATRFTVNWDRTDYPTDSTDGTKQFAFDLADTASYNDTTTLVDVGGDSTLYWRLFSFSATDSSYNQDTVLVQNNDAPVASAVSVTGNTYIDSILTGTYTYTDNESDAEGTSTFKWYRNGAFTDSTRQYYTLSSADSSYYLRFSVVPVAAAGATPGVETFADSVGPVVDGAVYYAEDGIQIGGSVTITDVVRDADTLWITANDTAVYKLIGDSTLVFTDRSTTTSPSPLITATWGAAIGNTTTKIQRIHESNDSMIWNIGGWCFAVSNAVTPPSFLSSDGLTWAWYIADETSTITKDGSNLVSDWEDYLGSGNDLEQGTETNQPVWSSDGVTFDGVDNFMETGTVSTATSNPFIYIVFKQVAWNNLEYIYGSKTAFSMALSQSGTTPDLVQYEGGAGPANSNLAVDTWGIVRDYYHSTDSKLIIDANSGDGTDANANLNGFTLGARAGPGGYSNIIVKEVIIRKGADTGKESDIYNYLKAKYGL